VVGLALRLKAARFSAVRLTSVAPAPAPPRVEALSPLVFLSFGSVRQELLSLLFAAFFLLLTMMIIVVVVDWLGCYLCLWTFFDFESIQFLSCCCCCSCCSFQLVMSQDILVLDNLGFLRKKRRSESHTDTRQTHRLVSLPRIEKWRRRYTCLSRQVNTKNWQF
jgi:hypothetical protein